MANDNINDDLTVCSECGGHMLEDAADPTLLRCENCGQTITTDEGRDKGPEEE